jgi:hypothetical protein
MQLAASILILCLIALSGAELLKDVNTPVHQLEEELREKINNWFKTPEDQANYLNNITKYPVSKLSERQKNSINNHND